MIIWVYLCKTTDLKQTQTTKFGPKMFVAEYDIATHRSTSSINVFLNNHHASERNVRLRRLQDTKNHKLFHCVPSSVLQFVVLLQIRNVSTFIDSAHTFSKWFQTNNLFKSIQKERFPFLTTFCLSPIECRINMWRNQGKTHIYLLPHTPSDVLKQQKTVDWFQIMKCYSRARQHRPNKNKYPKRKGYPKQKKNVFFSSYFLCSQNRIVDGYEWNDITINNKYIKYWEWEMWYNTLCWIDVFIFIHKIKCA